jgi:hypothetical protein
MLRGTIVFVLFSLAALITLPFLVSSLYIDQRGVIIPGRVHSKSESVVIQYSGLKHFSEVTLEYSKPDGTGESFFVVRLSPAEYPRRSPQKRPMMVTSKPANRK